MQPRQRNRIPSIRFDPLTRPFRNQSRSDNHAFVAERLDLAIKPMSRWSGFKADMQPIVSICQSLDRPLDRQRAVLDIAEKPAFSRPPSFRDRDRVLLLGDVESQEDFAILSHGPHSVHEARLGMPEQPSFLHARKGGPPAQPANMTSSLHSCGGVGRVFESDPSMISAYRERRHSLSAMVEDGGSGSTFAAHHEASSPYRCSSR
jgi:hypothetical protein